MVAAIAGIALGAWVLTVWLWQDPFTALYTRYEQHELAGQYQKRVSAFRSQGSANAAGEIALIAREATRYRLDSHAGEAMGTIDVPRLGLDHMMLVDGTDSSSLERGPGIYRGDFLPGEHQLVYIAGHRTTFLAPFADITALRRGDSITIALPYGSFVYRVTGSQIVAASDTAALLTHNHEQLVLQACYPRFSASHRYLAYATLAEIIPLNQPPISGPALEDA
jgi:sortase A